MSEKVRDEPARTSAFIVRGRVQGVGFRWSAKREADRLGVAGTIWNREDGGVEVYAQGPDAAVRRFEQWLTEGPPGALVERLEPVPVARGQGAQDVRVDAFTIRRGPTR